MEILKKYKNDIIIFIILFILLSFIVILLIPTPDWDFYNYHYYIGHAFLNNRIETDFLPANYRSYFNPYMDVITFLLMKHLNNHPYIFLSISTLDNTFFLFMIYKLGNLLLNNLDKIYKNLFIFLIVVYIAFMPILFDGLNYSMNDVATADFAFVAMYLFIKNIFTQSKNRNFWILLSGIFAGIGFSLKNTALVYIIPYFIVFLLQRKSIISPFKTFLYFMSGLIGSVLIVGGPWLFTIYKNFHNPVFPYYNNIFKSELCDPVDIGVFSVLGSLPRNIYEFIFYPFMHCDTRDIFFGSSHTDWDPRYAINFICVLILSCYLFITRKNNEKMFFGIIEKNHLIFLLIYVVFSYYACIYFTGAYRYIVLTSALYGFTLFAVCLLTGNLFKLKQPVSSAVLLLCVLLFTYLTSTYLYYDFSVKKPFRKGAKLFYNNENYGIEDNSYVIMLNMPTSYVAVEQNQKAKYYGFVLPSDIFEKYKKYIHTEEKFDYYAHFMFSKYLEKELSSILSNPKNKIYIIYSDIFFHEQIYNEALDFYSGGIRKVKNCREVKYKGIVTYDEYTSFVCDFN